MKTFPTLQEIAREIQVKGDIYDQTIALIRAFQGVYRGNSPSIRELALLIDYVEGKPVGKTSAYTVGKRLEHLERRGAILRPFNEFGERSVPRIILNDQAT